jgi:hypothetical protein
MLELTERTPSQSTKDTLAQTPYEWNQSFIPVYFQYEVLSVDETCCAMGW